MSAVFTFGTGDEAVLAYREPPRRTIRKIQHWRECRTVAEQLDAVRALFEAVLHGDTQDGEPLYDCSKLVGTGYLDDVVDVLFFGSSDLFDASAEINEDLQWRREQAIYLWETVVEAVDPGRVLRDPPGGVTMAITREEAEAIRRSR